MDPLSIILIGSFSSLTASLLKRWLPKADPRLTAVVVALCGGLAWGLAKRYLPESVIGTVALSYGFAVAFYETLTKGLGK